jgi:hypothetical protein
MRSILALVAESVAAKRNSAANYRAVNQFAYGLLWNIADRRQGVLVKHISLKTSRTSLPARRKALPRGGGILGDAARS